MLWNPSECYIIVLEMNLYYSDMLGEIKRKNTTVLKQKYNFLLKYHFYLIYNSVKLSIHLLEQKNLHSQSLLFGFSTDSSITMTKIKRSLCMRNSKILNKPNCLFYLFFSAAKPTVEICGFSSWRPSKQFHPLYPSD